MMLRNIGFVLFFLFGVFSVKAAENPLLMAENKGQWSKQIKYVADLTGGKLVLEQNKIGFLFHNLGNGKHNHGKNAGHQNPKAHLFNIVFDGANTQTILPFQKESHYRNYFIGNDKKMWASNVRLFREVVYQNLYPGIDFKLNGDVNGIEYTFTVKPNADANQIVQTYEGIDKIDVSKNILSYKTAVNTISEKNLIAYQIINGERSLVKCIFKKLGNNKISYSFPDGYDNTKELIIDPTIVFSTYTGATADNFGYTATYGNDGSMYVGGYVNNTPPNGNFYPTTPGAFQPNWGGGTGGNNGGGSLIGFACDMAITKFSSNGVSLLYSTYVGGSNNETPHSLVVDDEDNLIIYGVSYSADYPVSANAFNNTYNGGGDIVVTKLDSSGAALIGSTFIGGTAADGINFDPLPTTYGNLKINFGDQNRGEVICDDVSSIYIASCTRSGDFPTTSGAIQTTFGGAQDACVFKLNDDCSQLLWSSYIGGSQDDAAYSIDLEIGGSIYLAGGTMSSNFPTRAGAVNQNYLGGQFDGFIAHIDANGAALINSTFIGTSNQDQIYFVKLDAARNVYVVGQTRGTFPVINAAYSNPNSGQFIVKLNPQLSSIIYSTTFGNSNGLPNISPTAFLVDTCENVYVSGWGAASGIFGNMSLNMSNLPVTSNAIKSTTDGTDFYIFVLAKNATNMLYGSYFGGNRTEEHVDGGTSRFDKRGVIYQAICAGCGGTSLTPTTPGVWSTTNRSSNCNLLGLKMDMQLGATEVTVNAFPRATGCAPLTVQFTSQLYNVQNIFWDFQDGSTSTQLNPIHVFTDTGTYNVMLIGIDSNSCNITDTAYVQVWVRNDSINADFLPNATIDCNNRNIRATTTGFPTTRYQWSFGDGNFSTSNSVNHNYTSAGNYQVTLIVSDSTKCNLTDTFRANISIPPLIDLNIVPSNSEGCSPLSVNFNNNTGYAFGTYKWYFGDGDSSSLASPTHVYLNEGNYTATVYWQDTNTCNKLDTAIFQISVIDSSADAGFNSSRIFYGCDSVLVSVLSNYQGADSEFWYFGNNYSATGNAASYTFIAPAFDTIWHIIIDNDKICKPIDTAYIIVSLEPLTTGYSIADTIGCVPFTTSFSGITPLATTEFYWFFGNGDSASGSQVQQTYTAEGVYSVLQVAVDSNSCVSIDSNYANIYVIDDFVDAQFDINIINQCDSDLYILLDDRSINAVNFYWDFGDGNTSTLQNPDHHYYTPGTYIITLIAEDTSRCHPLDTIRKTVTLKPNSVANFEGFNVCRGFAITFSNQSIIAPQSFWDFGDGGFSNSDNPSHVYASAGDYNVTLVITDTSSCNVSDTITKTFTVFEQPDAQFYMEKDTYGFQTPVVFTNQSINANTYYWSFGDGNLSNEFSPTHIYDNTFGWQNVCLEVYTADAPCRDTFCDRLYILFTPLIGVPNAFSPNGDGLNDIVRVEGKGIVELEFRIFNRWGQEVFYTTDPKIGWDGVFKGEPQDMEVYTYFAKAKFITGQPALLKGNITLLR
jgi:gliding motility-associated-like protein